MVAPDDLGQVIDRIAARRFSDRDIEVLRYHLRSGGTANSVQVGRYNVRLENGQSIHVGDRHYYGPQAENIREIIEAVMAQNRRASSGGASDLVSGVAPGSLRGFGGFVRTIGVLVAMVGAAMFAYGLYTMVQLGTSNPDHLRDNGPPSIVFTGFAVVGVGVFTILIGNLVTGWGRR